jgi:hypothetical protein
MPDHVLAHTCQSCRDIVIERPPDKALAITTRGADYDMVPIFDFDGRKVQAAASNKCEFFAWALQQLIMSAAKHEHEILSTLNEQWTFAGTMYRKYLREFGDLQRLYCRWYYGGKAYLDVDVIPLCFIAEEGWCHFI